MWGRFETTCEHRGKRPINRERRAAEEIVKKLNGNPNGGTFRVDQLLKSTTGLDVADLSTRITRREDAQKRADGMDERPRSNVSACAQLVLV